ncbi:MAG: hypothetical protein A3F72_14675 [Bacteroidetes bacterium RIFCSPLOWO2_12_FULL_35_15]|nr:MAG: hypothetical protein A3F72_14675 [Bacteroidetes bacterium RIFCSPLOWO2_12_FULL_35_15]
MKNSKTSSSIEKIGIRTGLLITVFLIAYFMVIKVLGGAHILELRLFNAVFVIAGVFYGINKHQKSLEQKDEFYFDAWAQGMFIVAVSTILFALFMSIYISYFDTALLKEIQASRSMGQYINGLNIFLALLMEGFVSGVIITFTAAQYFAGRADLKSNEDSSGFVQKDKSRIGSKV